MPRVAATRELLAPREEVWRFLVEPHHLPDWWPGVRGVHPDRRGLAPGARWQLTAGPQTGGLMGAFLGRRLSPLVLRGAIILVGTVVAARLLLG